MTTWAQRSVPEIVTSWQPKYDEKWRAWIRESYGRYASSDGAIHLHGLEDFAIIAGDSGAPELCVLIALYGLTLTKTENERRAFDSHIRIVTVGIGIEHHVNPPPGLGVPPGDYHEREKWHLDRPAWLAWREHKLQDFGGDRKSAADVSVRLACIHAGVFTSDVELTFETLCDPSHWHLTTDAESDAAGNDVVPSHHPR